MIWSSGEARLVIDVGRFRSIAGLTLSGGLDDWSVRVGQELDYASLCRKSKTGLRSVHHSERVPDWIPRPQSPRQPSVQVKLGHLLMPGNQVEISGIVLVTLPVFLMPPWTFHLPPRPNWYLNRPKFLSHEHRPLP